MAIDFGGGQFALGASTSHEKTQIVSGSPHNEGAMDMLNNITGGSLGCQTRLTCEQQIKLLVSSGGLIRLDGSTVGRNLLLVPSNW